MNKLEQVATEKFNGDLNAAMRYIIDICNTSEELEVYTDEFTPDQAAKFLEVFMAVSDEKIPEKEQSRIISKNVDLVSLDLTREEIENMPVNPYKAKLGKDILKFLLINAGLIIAYSSAKVLGVGPEFTRAAASLGSLFTALVSLSTAQDILKFFKFKKLKNQFELEKDDPSRGRGI